MRITRQQVCAHVLSRGIDDCVGRGELVLPMQIGGKQSDGGVQRNNDALQRIGDDLIGLVLTHFPDQPFRQLELHDGRHDELRFLRKLLAQPSAERTGRKPFDPGGGIDDAPRRHQNRSLRSR
jgi:hypothetical protein